MRAPLTVFAITATSLALAACQPPSPKGIDAQTLQDAISDAIGDCDPSSPNPAAGAAPRQ